MKVCYVSKSNVKNDFVPQRSQIVVHPYLLSNKYKHPRAMMELAGACSATSCKTRAIRLKYVFDLFILTLPVQIFIIHFSLLLAASKCSQYLIVQSICLLTETVCVDVDLEPWCNRLVFHNLV